MAPSPDSQSPNFLDGLEGRRVGKRDCCCWGLIRWRLVFNQHHGNDDARTKPPPDPLPPHPLLRPSFPSSSTHLLAPGHLSGPAQVGVGTSQAWGWGRRVSLGRNYRAPYRKGLTLEKARERLRRYGKWLIPPTAWAPTGSTLTTRITSVYLHGNLNSFNLPYFKEKRH